MISLPQKGIWPQESETPTLDERPPLAETPTLDEMLPVCVSPSSSVSLSGTTSPEGRRKVQKETMTRKNVGDELNKEGADTAERHSPGSSKKKKPTDTVTCSGTPEGEENSLTKPPEEVITIGDDNEEEPPTVQDSIVLKHSYEASQAVQKLHDTNICGHKMRMEGATERGVSLGKANHEEQKIIEKICSRSTTTGNEQRKEREATEKKERNKEETQSCDLKCNSQDLRTKLHESRKTTQKEKDRRTPPPKHPDLMKNRVEKVSGEGGVLKVEYPDSSVKEVSEISSTNLMKVDNKCDNHTNPISNKDCMETKEVKVENNDEKARERNNVDETLLTSTNLLKENLRVIKEVTGLIFQFSPKAILFEFTFEEDSDQFQVGMVEPSKVRVGDGNIPADAFKTKEALDRYIEVGDELECEVVKEEGMEMVSVQEEDEEGAMVEVEIKPDWRAR